jgi:hypothetical protein
MILGIHWRDIVVISVHVPKEGKIYDMKDIFYDQLEHKLNKFPKCHMEILLYFNAEVDREKYFQTNNCERDFT